MEKRRDIVVGMEVLIEISFPVTVEIMEKHDAVACSHINIIVYNFQSHGFKQTGSNSPPCDLLKTVVDSTCYPDIAGICANHQVTVVFKSQTGRSYPCLVSIVKRQTDIVYRIGIVVRKRHSFFAIHSVGIFPEDRIE